MSGKHIMSGKQILVSAVSAAIAATAVLAPPALAFSKREIADAAYHYGRVDYAAEKCEKLGSNEAIRKEAGETLFKADEQAWKNGHDLGMAEAKDFLDESGLEAFCELSWIFYGRDGQTVKNLLVRR